MGRGRQKAKATKQAREMKYYSPQTDYSALERELMGSKSPVRSAPREDRDESSESEDRYPERD